MDKLTISNQMLTYKILLDDISIIAKDIQYQGNSNQLQQAHRQYNGIMRLINQHNNQDFSKFSIELNSLNASIFECWTKLTIDLCNYLNNIINNRKTKGGEFSEIKQSINKYLDDVNTNKVPTYEDYKLIINNLIKLSDVIEEKINNEKFNIIQYWKSIAIGFVLGIFGTLLTTFLFGILRF
jgi:hypothetical protein